MASLLVHSLVFTKVNRFTPFCPIHWTKRGTALGQNGEAQNGIKRNLKVI